MERLVIIENGEERIHTITGRIITVGRSSKNDVPIKDRNASRRQCNIIKIGDAWYVVDCDSQNGTFVNGERIKKKELEDGDKIAIASVEMIFLIAKERSEIPDSQGTAKPENNAEKIPELNVQKKEADKEEDDNYSDDTSASGLLAQVGLGKEDIPPISKRTGKIPMASAREEDKKLDSKSTLPPPKKYPASGEQVSSERVEIKVDAKTETKVAKSKDVAIAMVASGQNIKWIKKCYEQLQKQIIPEMIEQEINVRQLFLAWISGGHCWLHGSSTLHQFVFLHKMAKCLGLSLQIIHIKNKEHLNKLEIDSDILVLANCANYYSEITDFISEQNLSSLNFQRTKNTKKPRIVICQNEPDITKIPNQLQNALMFKIELTVTTINQEISILKYWHEHADKPQQSIMNKEDINYFQDIVESVKVPDNLLEYIVRLVCSANPEHVACLAQFKDIVHNGIDTYTQILLLKAAKVYAAFQSREEITLEDIQEAGETIITQRLILVNEVGFKLGSISNEKEELNDTKRLYQKLLKSVESIKTQQEKNEKQ